MAHRLIGDGYHRNLGIGFGQPGFPPRLDVLERAWFDGWLRDEPNGCNHYGPSYCAADGSFLGEPDKSVGGFFLNPSLRTVVSRDTTQVLAGVTVVLGGGFTYDNGFAEKAAVSFTSGPAYSATVITGPMNLHMRVICRAPEALWVVMMCNVAPGGRSTVLTNGAATHLTTSRRRQTVVVRTERRLHPVLVGEPLTLDIDPLTTESSVEADHRLRIDIFAADAPRFLPIFPDLLRTRGRSQVLAMDAGQSKSFRRPTARLSRLIKGDTCRHDSASRRRTRSNSPTRTWDIRTIPLF